MNAYLFDIGGLLTLNLTKLNLIKMNLTKLNSKYLSFKINLLKRIPYQSALKIFNMHVIKAKLIYFFMITPKIICQRHLLSFSSNNLYKLLAVMF